MATAIPDLNTVGVIARRSDSPIHRVNYVIRSRDIKPAGRAGGAYVFSESDVQYIQSELRRIADERGELL